AHVGLRHTGQTGDWRRDLGVAEVQLRRSHRGARSGDLAFSPLLRGNCMIEVLLTDRVALGERPQPRDVGIGLPETRLGLVQAGSSLRDRGLIFLGIDLEQQLAAVYERALFVRLLRQESFDPCANLDVVRTERLRGPLDDDGNVTDLYRR